MAANSLQRQMNIFCIVISLSVHLCAHSEPSLDNISTTQTPNVFNTTVETLRITKTNSTSNLTMEVPSPEDMLRIIQDMIVRYKLKKMLQALGPRFEDSLPPPAPTSATLPPLNTTIRVETGGCPENFKRCSSQTFFPSCDMPRNTDEHLWNQRFTLFFDISSELSSIHRRNLLNATLRLYKNLSLPLTNPCTLTVKVHVFTRSLKINRERSIVIASTRVDSDYVGWVFLDLAKSLRYIKGRHNYGIKITVQDENRVPWNIPNLFVKMDCQASNDILVPLPFEVQLENDSQKYPALNIRSGTEEIITNNDEYLEHYGMEPLNRNGLHQVELWSRAPNENNARGQTQRSNNYASVPVSVQRSQNTVRQQPGKIHSNRIHRENHRRHDHNSVSVQQDDSYNMYDDGDFGEYDDFNDPNTHQGTSSSSAPDQFYADEAHHDSFQSLRFPPWRIRHRHHQPAKAITPYVENTAEDMNNSRFDNAGHIATSHYVDGLQIRRKVLPFTRNVHRYNHAIYNSREVPEQQYVSEEYGQQSNNVYENNDYLINDFYRSENISDYDHSTPHSVRFPSNRIRRGRMHNRRKIWPGKNATMT